jgi:hypothetical protein
VISIYYNILFCTSLLLNLGHMTTCRRCRQHLVLTPPHSIPHLIFLTLFYPLYSSQYSSLYPLPRRQHTYHSGRPCRLGRQQPLYRKTDRLLMEAVTQIVLINQFFTHKMHSTMTVLHLFYRGSKGNIESTFKARDNEELCLSALSFTWFGSAC